MNVNAPLTPWSNEAEVMCSFPKLQVFLPASAVPKAFLGICLYALCHLLMYVRPILDHSGKL